jgi:hypothetical protein
MHWMKHYRSVKKSHKKIAIATFNSCIEELKRTGLIAKEDVNGRGKK